ncbi:MAG: hypothetical protein LQ351_000256 [Letrouitia transgressa]|nr:MAG: hypothetical protein LQ351_000256 [Letrouitia transgressa]
MLGARVSRVKFETSEVELISGQRLKGDLILGADGENSVCREWLLSQANSPRSSGDIVYRLAIPASRISSNPSIATLVDPPRVFAWFGPKSHAVCYPLQKDGIINVVLTFPESEGTAVIGPQPGDLGTIRNLCKEWDPQFQQLLGEAESTLKWTLLEPQYLKQWSHHLGKFILIGDSAHATLPYLAQGAALALESAYILSVLLQHITNLEQLPRILALFEKSRIPRSVRTREYSKYLHDMCQLVDGPAQMERDRIFREEQPGKGFPNPWSDLEFQEFAWDFDATAEADRIWKKMNGGRESV